MQKPLAQRSPEAVLVSLARLGAYLDAADIGRIHVRPAQYQVAARAASRLLEDSERAPQVAEICAVSPALREMWESRMLTRALSTAVVSLPQQVLAQLTLNRRPPART